MLPRSIVATLSALALTATSLLAQASATVPAAATASPTAAAKVTAPELAYWKQLQADLAELRAANLKAHIRNLPIEATPEALSAIAARLEKFLDQRDKDPVADLGADFKDYRDRLAKLVELALAPVTAAAKFKSTLATQGEERMMAAYKILNQVEAVDDYKPRLALLHDMISQRVHAAGGPTYYFFQTLGIGDKPRAAGVLGSPEERDAQFLTDSAAIGPIFADLAKGQFVDNRVKHGLTEGLMDPLIQTIDKFRTQFAEAPTDQLQEGLQTATGMQEEPGQFNLKRHVLRLELLHREDNTAYTIAMEEFQGAFLRWLGKIDDLAPLGLCRDVAAAQDGSWFAYAPAEKTVVIRDAAGGKIRATLETGGAVRALAPAPGNQLLLFTSAGLFTVDATAAAPQPAMRSPLKTAFIEPRIASSRAKASYVFALGIKPGVQRDGVEETFSVEKSASRITSVATSADGLTVAYGYAGDNVTGSGEPHSGYSLLQFTGSKDEFRKQGAATTSHEIGAPMTAAVLSLSMSADGKQVASAWFGVYGGVVVFDENPAGENKRHILTIDADTYHWVQLLEGKTPRVVAGTRSGNVRVWDATSRELLASFSVPAGPGGTAYGVVGEEIVSVALGQPGVHRWKLADGSLVASYDGAVAPPAAAALAARLAAERELIPARETLIAALDAADTDSRVKAIETLRGPQSKLLDGLGQRPMIDSWFALIRIDQVNDLGKDKRPLEAFELGYKEITTGVLHPYLTYITLYVANHIARKDMSPDIRQRVLALGERAIALYPTDINIHREYREARVDSFKAQGKTTEAMQEVDELDLIDSTEAPHADRRYGILMSAYLLANKAGRDREAMQALVAASRYNNDHEKALMLANNIFALACKLTDWPVALNAANMVLQLDPSMKTNESFMYWARYAYQQVNPKP